MDHKVSKDMISSGMIPSGEKTQADLGRTQYGSAPSPNSLMEAYRSIYEHHQKDADGKVIEHDEKEELNEGKMPEGLKNYLMKKKGKKEDKKDMKEGVGSTLIKGLSKVTKLGQKALVGAGGVGVGVGGGKLMHDSAKDANNKKKVKEGAVDLFDLVKGRLIDEGCDEQEAINIMINLSESEINEILGGVKGDGYIGHPRLGIKNPLNPPKKETKKTNGGKGLTNKLGNRATEIERMLNQ